MAGQADFKVILTIDSQGNVKIEELKRGLQEVEKGSAAANQRMAQGAAEANGHLDNTCALLSRQAAALITVAGAVYATKQAYSYWFSLVSQGIGIVDDYQKKIVGTSYILSTMSNVPPPDLSKAYAQWTEFHKWLYQESIRVDKQSAASSGEIFTVALELEKKGVIANTQEKMSTVGRFTDLMKGVIPTYASLTEQARGEVEAVMSGMMRIGSQTSYVLGQIDPAFKKNIASARENNTVLEYLESLLPKIDQYTKDLMGTWDAVGASLKSAWQIINIQAFGDAHKDVVGFATELGNRLVDNGKLTKEGEAAARALGQAWATAKEYIEEAFDYLINNPDKVIRNIETFANATARVAGFVANLTLGFAKFLDTIDEYVIKLGVGIAVSRSSVGYLGESFTILGKTARDVIHGIIFNFGEIGPAASRGYAEMQSASERWSLSAIQDANNVRFAVMNSMMTGPRPAGFAFMGGEKEAPGLIQPKPTGAPPVPPVRPFSGKPEKGGGAADAEANRLMSLFDTLTRDIARLSEGSAAEVEANLEKTINQIYKKIEHTVVSEAELEVMARHRAALQKGKIEEDFWNKLAKESGDAFAQINRDYQEDLRKSGQLAGAKEAIEWTWRKRVYEVDQKQQTDLLALQKGGLDALAGALPFLSQRLPLERQSLELEISMGRATLENKIWEMELTDESRKRLGLAPLLNQALKDELRGRQGVLEAARRYTQEQKGWQTQGAGGGMMIWAQERAGEMQTRGSQEMVGAMKRSESYFADTLGQAWTNSILRRKNDLRHLWEDILGSAMQFAARKNVQSLFDMGAHFRGGGKGGGRETSYGDVPNVQEWNEVAQRWTEVADENKGAADILDSAGVTGIAAGASLGLGALGLITGSQTLMIAATAIQAAAMLLEIAAMMDLLPFHGGGIVAHAGLIVAHDGLDLRPNERLAKLLVGEWVLQPDATRHLEDTYGPNAFQMFNSGRVPAVPLPVPVAAAGSGGGYSGPSKHVTNLTINQVTPDGRVVGRNSYQIVVDLVNKGIEHKEIRLPASRRR